MNPAVSNPGGFYQIHHTEKPQRLLRGDAEILRFCGIKITQLAEASFTAHLIGKGRTSGRSGKVPAAYPRAQLSLLYRETGMGYQASSWQE